MSMNVAPAGYPVLMIMMQNVICRVALSSKITLLRCKRERLLFSPSSQLTLDVSRAVNCFCVIGIAATETPNPNLKPRPQPRLQLVPKLVPADSSFDFRRGAVARACASVPVLALDGAEARPS